MRAYEEQDAIDCLKKCKVLADRMQEIDLLEILARDDQPNNTRDIDSIHKAISNVCKELGIAAESLQVANNITAHLVDKTPKMGRVSVIEDCMACDGPCIPKAIKGLCGECLKEYRAGSYESHGDFVVWKRANK